MAMGSQGAVSIMDFLSRYKAYEESRNASHELMTELLVYAQRLENFVRDTNTHHNTEMMTLKMELEASNNSRRTIQQHQKDLEQMMEGLLLDNKKLKNQNSYVLVLIDGDGLIFQQEFLRQGAEGGRRAARQLHRALAADPLVLADGAQIIVKVFADIKGLSKVLERDGSVGSESTLSDFVVGFNQATFFDFVDVGSEKENAISKLKEHAVFHMQSPNCKQVVIGVSDDGGYGAALEEIVQTSPHQKEFFAVLEGPQTVRAVATLGLGIIKLKDVFRSDKLMDRRTVSTNSVQSRQSGSSGTTLTSDRPATASYATITRKVTPPPQVKLPIPLAPKNTNSTVRAAKQPAKPAWNPGPRGLDDPIPLNPIALETIKKRKDNNKLCNNHFLRGPCAKGDACCFVHDYAPNKEERHAIAFLARLNPCTNGQECDVENCIYGHHCPSVINGICTHPFCKFGPEDHPPGTKLRSQSLKT